MNTSKRLVAAFAGLALLPVLGACSNINIRHDYGTCPPGDRNVQLHAGIFRPEMITPGGERRPAESLSHEAEIHFEAWSPEPGFTGLTIAPKPGSGSRANQQVPPGQGPGAGATVAVSLPWDGTACWGTQHPAGLLMQVTIPDLSGLVVEDAVECFMEEGSVFERDDSDFVGQDSIPFDLTDFIPGAKTVVAHCVGIFTPDDWAGAPVDGGPPHP